MELFKYMPYRERFFSNPSLCFTALSDFNDPFEGQIRMSSLESAAYNMKKNSGTPWEPITNNDPSLQQQLLAARKIVPNDELGILSLSGSKHSLLMWAHYAKKHEGIVLGLDSLHPFFNQTIPPKKSPPEDTSFLGKLHSVSYDRIRHNIEIGTRSFQNLLRKSDEWMYEKEHRMFLRRGDCDDFGKDSNGNKLDRVNLFRIPEKAIIRVILGERADTEAILQDFLDAKNTNPNLAHIIIEKAELHRDLYHIEHQPLYLGA